jgi:shikimate kinase
MATLRELYAQRDPLYREVADVVVETGAQSVQALARVVLEKLEERWKASA